MNRKRQVLFALVLPFWSGLSFLNLRTLLDAITDGVTWKIAASAVALLFSWFLLFMIARQLFRERRPS